MEKAKELSSLSATVAKVVVPQENAHAPANFSSSEIAKKSLAIFLKEKNATSVQTVRFLATSAWLEAKGSKRLSAKDVSQALKDANQARLGNPADCLAKNIQKGYCEKDGKQYFVTEEGKQSLGL